VRQCLGLAVLYTLSSSGQPERLDTNTIVSVTYQSLLTAKSTLSITKFVIPAIYQEWYQSLTHGLLIALHPTCEEILYSNRHFLLHYAAFPSRALCSNQLESLRSQPYFSRTPRNRIASLGLVSMSFIMDIVHSDPAKKSKISGPFVFLSLPGEFRNQIYTSLPQMDTTEITNAARGQHHGPEATAGRSQVRYRSNTHGPIHRVTQSVSGDGTTQATRISLDL